MLVWRILFRWYLGACMLLKIFVSTTINPKLKTRVACGQLADDRSHHRPRFNASMLIWRILFRWYMGACMLLKIFASSTFNPKLKDTRRLWSAR
jgi:hypothetical protein